MGDDTKDGKQDASTSIKKELISSGLVNGSSATANKPSGFAAVISGRAASDTSSADSCRITEVGLQLNERDMSDVQTHSATPLDEDPGRLQIDSRGNSPANSGLVPAQASNVEPVPAAASASIRAPSGSITQNQSSRSSSSSTVSHGGRSPQLVHARSGPGISQLHSHHNVPSSNPSAVHACVHQPQANFHLAPTSNSAGVILPFAASGTVHSQHYGLLTSTFGAGGGQTIIVNQYGQPVGVVSPSPAAGPQGVALPTHSGTTTASSVQVNPSVSQFPSNPTAAGSCAATRPPPLIMAYRQPGPAQHVSAPAHIATNPPASSATNANMAAAAAAAAHGMHSIPLFPSHFNPFAACNAPILLPTGQMVFRTPQGQLIGFQVPAMASHHPMPGHPPPHSTLEPQQGPQQQQHLSQPLPAASTKYPQVLPKIAPSTNPTVSVHQASQHQSLPTATATAGPSSACGPFAAMPSTVTSLLQQQLSIPPKAAHKTMPVLPMVPGASSAPVTGGQDQSAARPEPASRSSVDKAVRLPSEISAESHPADLNPVVPASAKSGGAAATKKAKTANGAGTKGKSKQKKTSSGAAPGATASMEYGARNDTAAGSLTSQLKGVAVIDDDPGPLRVYTTENSEQMASEIHDMFARALADHKSGDGPPQILTHIIDGFVIQESMDPFPISPHPFDDFNISSVVMTTDSLSEWSAPPQLSPACARPGPTADPSQEHAVCPHCGRVIEDAPYTKAPAYCSRFCYKAFQRMEETSVSPGGKRNGAGASAAYSSGTSSVQSPATVASPKTNLSPNGCVEGKPPVAESMAAETSDSGLLRIASPVDVALEKVSAEVANKRAEEWTVEDVCNWVTSLGEGISQHAATFRQQEIDGQALLLLEEHHLTRGMGMKFGPALKLCAALNRLRKKC